MPADVLILEDDSLSRMYLATLVRNLPNVGRIHEADTVGVAVEKVSAARVYFVDIELGKDSGFDFVRRIPEAEKAAVIFTTAHSSYAHFAFDCEAVDYLVKPVTRERLEEAWRRALVRLHLNRPVRTFPLETPTGIERLEAMHLISVEAVEGDSVRLHLRDTRRPFLRKSFKKWLETFPEGELVECSRGVAVNPRHIRELGVDASGVPFLRLSDDRVVPVSRRRMGEMREILLRIGHPV